MINTKKIVDNIIDNFDFDRVHEVMTLLGWTWWNVRGIPSVQDLKKRAGELLTEVWEKPNDQYCISTGGFHARKDSGVLILEFVITDWAEDIADYIAMLSDDGQWLGDSPQIYNWTLVDPYSDPINLRDLHQGQKILTYQGSSGIVEDVYDLTWKSWWEKNTKRIIGYVH